MANHHKLGEESVFIRNRILKSCSQKAKTEKNMRWSLKILRSSIHHHLTELIKEGYVKRTKVMIEGRMQYCYEALKFEYIDVKNQRPKSEDSTPAEFYNPFSFSRIVHVWTPKTVIQSDKVKWTPTTPQRRHVRIGSTLGDSYL